LAWSLIRNRFRPGNKLLNSKVKEKIEQTVVNIELRRKDLHIVRQKLERRKEVLFNGAFVAVSKEDDLSPLALRDEHEEIKKAITTVKAGELALLQMQVRLETLKAVGDALVHLDSALRSVAQVKRDISLLAPDIEVATRRVNDELTNILTDLGGFERENGLDSEFLTSEELVKRAEEIAQGNNCNLDLDGTRNPTSQEPKHLPDILGYEGCTPNETIRQRSEGDTMLFPQATANVFSSEATSAVLSGRNSRGRPADDSIFAHDSSKRGTIDDVEELSSKLRISPEAAEKIGFALAKKGMTRDRSKP
jgi:hypothetical protein